MLPENTIKGRLVESIVAALHKSHYGTRVETNVHLPVKSGAKRTREIDVLLTGEIGGWPLQIAIECKNYKKKIGAAKIDEFAGKLRDVGLPREGSIFVSAHGFTKDALDRAKNEHIRPLLLTGLTPDHMGSQILSAMGSTIYLVPELKGHQFHFDYVEDDVLRDHPDWTSADVNCQIPLLLDRQNKMSVLLPDLIGQAWKLGLLQPNLGLNPINVDFTDEGNLFARDGNHVCRLTLIELTIEVKAMAISQLGQATRHALVNPLSNVEEKFTATATFPAIQEEPLITLYSEDEITSFVNTATKLAGDGWHFYQRIIVPRVLYKGLFWPLSQRIQEELLKKRDAWDEKALSRIFSKHIETVFEE